MQIRILSLLLLASIYAQAGTIDMLQGKWRSEADPRATIEFRGFKAIFNYQDSSPDTVNLNYLTGAVAGVHTAAEGDLSKEETLMLFNEKDTSFWSVMGVGLEIFSAQDQQGRKHVYERVGEGMLISPYKFVYNGGNDTLDFYAALKLHGTGVSFPASTQIHHRFQLDGRGPEEIVFWMSRQHWNSRHGGTFDISEQGSTQTYMIWNLATGECHWRCNARHYFSCHNFEVYMTPQRQNGHCSYSYDVKFGASGDIMISNLKEENKITNGETDAPVQRIGCQPDKAPGIYRFIDGEYIYLEH